MQRCSLYYISTRNTFLSLTWHMTLRIDTNQICKEKDVSIVFQIGRICNAKNTINSTFGVNPFNLVVSRNDLQITRTKISRGS